MLEVILDTETTGLSTLEKHRIVEIGCVELNNQIPTDVYPTLYETFIYLFKQAGIKDINIEKNLNFEAMYNEKKKV